jgi:hypothetical protein
MYCTVLLATSCKKLMNLERVKGVGTRCYLCFFSSSKLKTSLQSIEEFTSSKLKNGNVRKDCHGSAHLADCQMMTSDFLLKHEAGFDQFESQTTNYWQNLGYDISPKGYASDLTMLKLFQAQST